MTHVLLDFMMSYPVKSLGDRFCMIRKGGTVGGGSVHPKGANSMVVSGLGHKELLAKAGKAHFYCFKCKWT